MAGPLATATEGAAADAFAHDPTAARLVAVQLLSPAFPTGGFAYAQGLEWAMDAGIVTDAATLGDWIGAVLAHGALWSDAVLMALVLRPGAGQSVLISRGGQVVRVVEAGQWALLNPWRDLATPYDAGRPAHTDERAQHAA